MLLADSQVLSQTGGMDGLWHRGTPFGADGYVISSGFDFVPLSHHVLTTDGILGRDTLGGTVAAPSGTPSWDMPPGVGRRWPAFARPAPSPPSFTAEGATP